MSPACAAQSRQELSREAVATLLWGQFRWPSYEDWVEGLDAGIDRQDGPEVRSGLGAVAGGPPSCASPERHLGKVVAWQQRLATLRPTAFGHPQVGDARVAAAPPHLRGLSVGLSQPAFGFSFCRQLPLVFCTYDADVWQTRPPSGSSVLGIEGREGPELSCPLGPLLSVLTPHQVTGHSVLTPLFLPKEPLSFVEIVLHSVIV